MNNDSNFSRLPDSTAKAVTIYWKDQAFSAVEGDSLAAALLANGIVVTRKTPKSGVERGPFCMMGACFECLVEIEGRGAVQACLTRVVEGLRVHPHPGLAEVSDD